MSDYSSTPLPNLTIIGDYPKCPKGQRKARFLGFRQLGETKYQGHFWSTPINGKAEEVCIPFTGVLPEVGDVIEISVSINAKGYASAVKVTKIEATPEEVPF